MEIVRWSDGDFAAPRSDSKNVVRMEYREGYFNLTCNVNWLTDEIREEFKADRFQARYIEFTNMILFTLRFGKMPVIQVPFYNWKLEELGMNEPMLFCLRSMLIDSENACVADVREDISLNVAPAIKLTHSLARQTGCISAEQLVHMMNLVCSNRKEVARQSIVLI